jgi:DNA-binding response OmpR family regulator
MEKESPAIIILDIALPGGDSREFMRRIRRSVYRQTPVIMTYVAPQEDAQEFIDMTLGIDARLLKPILPKELLSFLYRILVH